MRVTFNVAGDQNQAQTNVDGALAATTATAVGTPQPRDAFRADSETSERVASSYNPPPNTPSGRREST